MTIEEIKERTQYTAPYFFSPDTMEFFHQSMNRWTITKDGTRFKISQNMSDSSHNNVGKTIRYFNPINNELERF